MSFSDELFDAPQDARRVRLLDRILREMSEDRRESLLQALATPHISSAHIAAVLRRNGHNIGETAVRAYRREVLATPRET